MPFKSGAANLGNSGKGRMVGAAARTGPGRGAIDHRYPNKRVVGITLSEEMVEKLRDMAVANGIALSEQIRCILAKALKHECFNPRPEEGEETS